MRVVVLLAPAFMAFGKAFIKKLREKDSSVEIIGLASTRKSYEAFRRDKSFEFLFLDCLEDREREWLDRPFDSHQLRQFEEELGSRVIGNILTLDRQVGAGLVSCALPIDTELTRRTSDANGMRSYMTGMLRYFTDLLDEYKPDSAFLYAIAGSQAGAIAWTMRARGLPVLTLQHTRLDDRFIVDTSITGLFDPIWKRYLKGEWPSPDYFEKARIWIEEFRARDKKPDYMTYNLERMKKIVAPGTIAKSAAMSAGRMLYYSVFPHKKQLRAENGWFRLKESFIVPMRSRAIAKQSFYDPYEPLKNSEFIYCALHIDPESSTMHFAPDFTDQIAVIEALARRRPLHMNVLVKEHPAMLGRRPPGFYERIRRLPGVYLINPGVSSYELIKRSKLVFTITGTVAWEAIVLGKPAIVLGDFPFLSFATKVGQGVKLAKIHTLAEDIEEALKMPPVPDEDLTRFISLLFEDSFSLSSGLFWGEVSDAVVTENIGMVDAMAEHFLKRRRESPALASAA